MVTFIPLHLINLISSLLKIFTDQRHHNLGPNDKVLVIYPRNRRSEIFKIITSFGTLRIGGSDIFELLVLILARF